MVAGILIGVLYKRLFPNHILQLIERRYDHSLHSDSMYSDSSGHGLIAVQMAPFNTNARSMSVDSDKIEELRKYRS